MMNDIGQLQAIQAGFRANTKVLSAIGHETRQLIIAVLIEAGCDGLRVGELTARTHLSRPAVSHHLKILKEAGIVDIYKVTTMNYYYMAEAKWMAELKQLINDMADSYSKTPSKEE